MYRKLTMKLTEDCKADVGSQQSANEFLRIMEKVGVKSVFFENGVIEVSWKDKDAGKVYSRNAGRKEIILDMDSVMKRKETEKLKDIAADLGVSRMTLYRKIKGFEQ